MQDNHTLVQSVKIILAILEGNLNRYKESQSKAQVSTVANANLQSRYLDGLIDGTVHAINTIKGQMTYE